MLENTWGIDPAAISLVCVDMDGTLLDSNKQVPPDLWPLLDVLDSQGVRFVPASGRQLATLRDMFQGYRLPLIADNGAIVCDQDAHVISSTQIDADTVREVVRRVRHLEQAGEPTGLVLSGLDGSFVERPMLDFEDAYFHYYRNVTVVEDSASVADQGIIKAALYHLNDVTRVADHVFGGLEQTHQVVVSGRDWADLTALGVDKGKAVQALQVAMGIGPRQTLAFGDFPNDLGMLAAAAHSFAMENAHPDVKAQAKHIAPPNSQAGVVRVLEAIFC